MVGVKRCFVTLMFVAVPLVSAEPISILQEVQQPPVIQIQAPAPKLSPKTTLKKKSPVRKQKKQVTYGIASWYSQSDPFINLRTANGEIFDDTKMTCASWHYPFGTRLKITNPDNGKSVICIVNDRGPAKRLNRLIDLSKGAFRKIANTKKGLIRVRVTKL
jgi:rare lipoprotein A